jgi:Putative zinc-finger
MDHDYALRIAAVEKYLLDELPQDERDQFEEHYFDCRECALDLRTAALFIDQAKKDLAGRPNAPLAFTTKDRRNPWSFLLRPALAAPVFAALLLVLGYQNLVTFPRLARETTAQSAPRILPTLSLATSDSRGGPLASLDSPGTRFLLQFDIPGDSRFVDYTCSLISPSGEMLWQARVSAQQAKDLVSLEAPPLKNGEGIYSLRVQGNSSAGPVDLARYRFAFKGPL